MLDCFGEGELADPGGWQTAQQVAGDGTVHDGTYNGDAQGCPQLSQVSGCGGANAQAAGGQDILPDRRHGEERTGAETCQDHEQDGQGQAGCRGHQR